VVCQSWYLLAPVLGLMVLASMATTRPAARTWVPLAALSAPFCAYPFATGPSGLHVDEGGPTLLPTIGGVVALLLVIGLSVARTLRGGTPATRLLVTGTAAALLSTALLVVQQGYVPGSGVSYYGAKLLLSTFLLGAVLSSAVAARAGRALQAPIVVGL